MPTLDSASNQIRARGSGACQTIVAVGSNDAEIETARQKARGQISFYGSTPAYKGVLEHHGHPELQPELNAMTKQGKWAEMNALISDELLDAIAVCAPIGEVGKTVRERCQGRADRVSLVAHWTQDPDLWDDVVRDLNVG